MKSPLVMPETDALQNRIDELERQIETLRAKEAGGNFDPGFVSFMHDIPVMVAAVDANDQFVFWNRACERVTGFGADEIVRNKDAIRLLCRDDDTRNRLLSEWKSSGDMYDWEWPIVTKNGETKVISWTKYEAADPLPEFAFWGLGVDITERSQAAEEVRRSERKFRHLIESSPQGIAIVRNGVFLFVNAALCELIGYDNPDELIGEDSVALHAASREHDRLRKMNLARLRGEEVPNRYEYEILRKDGKPIWCEALISIVDWEGEQAALVAHVDITERKLAEEEIHRTEKKFRNLIEGSLQGIAIIRDTKFLFVNKALCDIYGFDGPGELLGRDSIPIVIAPHEQERIRNLNLDRLRGEDVPSSYEFQGMRRDGQTIWLETLATVVDWEGGPAVQVTYIDITERKLAEEEMRRSEEKHRNLIEGSLQGLSIVRDATFLFVNQALCDIYGFDEPSELVGRNSLELVHSQDEKDLQQDMNRRRLRGEDMAPHYEFQGIRRDGSLIWLEVMVTVINWEGARASQITYIDISERKRAEEELLHSEEKFRNLVEGSLQGMAIIRNDRFLFVNQALADIHGYSDPSDFYGQNAAGLMIAPEERERLTQYNARRLRGEEVPDRYEFQGLHRDGSRIWLETLIRTVTWDGKPAAQVTYIDITERKKSDTATRRLAAAVDQSGDAMFITDTEGIIEYVNPAFEAITGYSSEEVLGALPRILNSGKQSRAFYANVWNSLKRGDTWKGRYINRRKDGTLYQTESTHSPIRDANGEITHFVSVQRDVSVQVALEEQMRRGQRMETIGTLAGGIAHDFNNILMPIIGFTEIARDGMPDGSPSHGDLTRVLSAAHRAKELVSQILLFSRHKEGLRETIHIRPIVKEIAKLLRSTLPKTISIRESISEDLHWISADPTQINQVLMNLCVNAGQAMPDGGEIDISADNVELQDFESYLGQNISGDYIRISVKDTGIGMDATTQSRMFEPFFTTKEVNEGTGLGLSTTFGIVHTHNGVLHVESAPGQGTTFEVYFKAVEKDNQDVAPAEPAVIGGNESILLIDDEPFVVDLEVKILRNLGYRVSGYTNGAEAVEAFQKAPHDFDLLLVDQTMPGLPGHRIVEAMQNIRTDFPVIVCTGNRADITEERYEGLAVNWVLLKPVAPDEMGRAVREVLDNRDSDSS